MQYFDYEKVALEAGISDEDLSAIKAVVTEEFPVDGMMWELHVLRVCMAIKDGRLTVEKAVGQPDL